jgi:hypothetical protein
VALRTLSRLVLLSGLALWGACDGWGTGLERVCTNLPCPAGLWVQLDGTPAAEYSVVAQVPGAAPWVVNCTPERPCDYIVFPDFTPPSVEIIYTTQDTVVTQSFVPQYEVTYPNGRDCGECRRATLVVTIGD